MTRVPFGGLWMSVGLLTTHPLAYPFVDADRRGGNRDNNGGLSARAWFAIAFAVFVAGWLFARLNNYWQ